MPKPKPKYKNLWAKTRPLDNPYLTIIQDKWEFRVLKAYQSRQNELKNPFARWLVAVKSPFTHDRFEIGDTYLASIPHSAHSALEKRLLDEQIQEQGVPNV